MQRIVPAILTDSPEELQNKLLTLKDHTKWVHIDIADGKFVPTKTVNIIDLQEAYQFFNIEVHLMVEHPHLVFNDCRDIGAKRVIFHAEAAQHIAEAIEAAKKYDFQVGVALNPETDISVVEPCADKLDALLFMSVHPGLQGNPFLPDVLEKIKKFDHQPSSLQVGIDGGISRDNIQAVFEAGVDYAVVGSRIVKAEHPIEALNELEALIEERG